jgi:hypothetical protein
MRRLGAILVFSLSLAAPSLVVEPQALANDTALQPGGYGPEPVGGGIAGKESVIEMAAEHLDIRFGKAKTTVDVQFVFRNTLKSTKARQLLGFPDIAAAQKESYKRDPKGDSPWFYPYSDVTGPMEGLETLVDDWKVPTKLQYGFVEDLPDGSGWKPSTPENGHLMAWHVVWVDFPPGKDVVVERRYTVKNGMNALGVSFFDYITHTGGIWHGPIGRLVADVTLADGLTVDKLIWPGDPITGEGGSGPYPDNLTTRPAKAEWKVLSPTAMRLEWRRFEPRTQANRRGFMLSTHM